MSTDGTVIGTNSLGGGTNGSGSGVRAFVASVSWDSDGVSDGEMDGVGDLVNEPSLVGNFFRHS